MLVAMLTCTIRSFGSNALDGASQITLLAVSALCVLIGMGWLNVPWASFEKAIVKNVSSVASALVILLLILPRHLAHASTSHRGYCLYPCLPD